MRTSLGPLLGIEHPIVGFSPSEHVAAAISRAGGLGVLGCVRFNDADELDEVLGWMDANTDGRPYGVDVVMPASLPTEGAAIDLAAMIPAGHKDFVQQTLTRLGVPPLPDGTAAGDGVLGWLHSVARQHVEVALAHPARLIAAATCSDGLNPTIGCSMSSSAHSEVRTVFPYSAVPVAASAGDWARP